MPITIALVPVVGLCALALLYLTLAALRSSRAAELKREHERFTQTVVERDAAIQKALLGDLLEGRSPAECLAGFEQQRAALLPGARLEEAAAWDAEELAEVARRRFAERLAELNRKLATGALTATVAIVGVCAVLSAVLYNFQSTAANTPLDSMSTVGIPADLPAPAVPDSFAPEQTTSPEPPKPAASDAPNSPSRDAGQRSHRPPRYPSSSFNQPTPRILVMNSTLPKSNGRRERSPAPPDLLRFLDVNHNSYRRNSVNSSWTYQRTTGRHDLAVTLWDKCLEDWQRRNPETPDLDGLNARAMEPVVQQRLQALAEIADSDPASLDHSEQLLRDLASRKSTKLVRQVRDMIAQTMNDVIEPLRARLEDLVHRSPFASLEVIDSFQRTLRDLEYPVPDFAPQKRFTNGMRALATITRASTLPPKLRDQFTAALRKQCVTEFHAAVAALVLDYIVEHLRQAVAGLLLYLDELRAGQATFRSNANAVRKHLDEQRTLARQRSVKSRSSVVLEMETPNEVQLLAGIRDAHRCTDIAVLVSLFADKLHVVLNETARQQYPFVRTPASLTDLTTKLPPAAVAAGITDVVADLLGDLHTVYTAARSFGVRRTAQGFSDRAAPLCDLSSRDHIRLNVETHRDVLVRLPQPRGAEDGEIAEQLREAFRELHPVCQFLVDPLETQISVVRTLVGFPIGIEATNAALLHDYAASVHQGHRPHLYGLMPESPDGRHLPQLLALAEHTPQL